ncbi:purine-cytosine permease family protein [Nocardioides albus]|uniref:Cytosine permease n=1 Tax=Nocardioides albus TaxID=1841 RepID=A0A7W5A1R4_9ACTN|nr:cytosine permease [Nocardioides albus]MBB3087873.1 cytosine permease [Nocardioides albus]GGU20934.1 cytosine permease [Nocardioides albus]
MGSTIEHDDYALSRVPQDKRYHWFSIAVQRFGMLSSLASFLIGATLGFGMSFWNAVLAITLGAVILEILTIFTGIAGQREGLSTSVLARWTGFGRAGSSVIGLAISISAIGWFGIQNAVSAQGLTNLIGVLPLWGWALVFGLAVTAIVVFGFEKMAWTAYITVPAFLVLAGWSIVVELSRHDFGDLLSAAPAGPQLSLIQGTSIVAGGFIVGAVITPDMSRFNRTPGDVVKQTVVGISVGEYVIGLIGVLLALALRTNDVIAIVTSTSGFLGTLVIIAATLKINDWNLYAASLGIVNFLDQAFGWRVHRGAVTLFVGIAGSIAGAAGILNSFTDFLILLGVIFPPIAGIMVAEYFIARTWRGELDSSRVVGELPATAPTWVPASLVVWAAASLIGHYVTWGIPSINSVIAALVLYVGAAKLGLVRGHGVSRTHPTEPTASVPAGA